MHGLQSGKVVFLQRSMYEIYINKSSGVAVVYTKQLNRALIDQHTKYYVNIIKLSAVATHKLIRSNTHTYSRGHRNDLKS